MRLRQSHAFVPAAALLGVGLLVFWDFLFGDALLLYKDIGADSIQSYYPEFVHLSHYIRTVGYPSWSFYVGMGQDLAYLAGYLIWQPVTWLPKAWIAYAFAWQHLAKLLLAGLLFYHYLRLRGLRAPAPLLGALLLAFSGYMAIGSCWYPLGDEVIAFPAVLLGCELAIQRGRWVLLAMSVAVTGMLNPFFLYLCALFLVGYVPLRLFAEHGWEPTTLARRCVALAAVAVLGVGLGAVITLPYLHVVFTSPRGLGTTSASTPLLATPVFAFESALHYVTAIGRAMSNDMMGAGDQFRGWFNYLEAPLNYAGLVSLLLAPQIFVSGSRRGRMIAAAVIFALIVPSIFPWFRHLFWLFKGNYYRTYSLFCILAMLAFAMVAFSRYLAGGKLSIWLLASTTAALLFVLLVQVTISQELMAKSVRFAAAIYLVAYTAILIAGQLAARHRFAGYAVIAIAAIELIHFNRISVGHRKFVTKSEWQARTHYNDETADAIRDIKAQDDSLFFRVTKPRPAVITQMIGLNDALVFGYYGTSSYSSFNNVNYTDFLTAAGELEPNSEVHTRWAIGTLNDPLLSTFAGEKYVLVDDPSFLAATKSYRFLREYGPNALFVNDAFMPLGLSFTRYIPEEEFLRLPATARAEMLLRAAVLRGDETHGLQPLGELANAPLASVIAERRARGLQLTSFAHSQLEGTVRLDEKSILIVQTPFDSGWRALADGRAARVVRTDFGLLGVVLPAGEQRVRMEYRNPWLLPGAVLTCVALLLVVFARWRWPRLRL